MRSTNSIKNRDQAHHKWVRTGLKTFHCNICDLTKITDSGRSQLFYRDNLLVENTGCKKIDQVDSSDKIDMKYLYKYLKSLKQNPFQSDFGIVIVPPETFHRCLYFQLNIDNYLEVFDTHTSLQVQEAIKIVSRKHLREIVDKLLEKEND